jgi:hypothetical protein
MYDITQIASFFTELAFPIAVAGFLLFVTTKQLDKLRVSNLRILIFLALLLQANNIHVPDDKINAYVKLLKKEREDE